MKHKKRVLSFLLVILTAIFAGTFVTASAASTYLTCSISGDGGITMKLCGLNNSVYGVQIDFTVNGVYESSSFTPAEEIFTAHSNVSEGDNETTNVTVYITAQSKMNSGTELTLGTLSIGEIDRESLPSTAELITLDIDLAPSESTINVNPYIPSGGGNTKPPAEDNKPNPEPPTNDETGTIVKTEITVDNGMATMMVSDELAEEIVNNAIENDSKTVTISPAETAENVTKTQVTIPGTLFSGLYSETSADLVLSMPNAEVKLKNSGFEALYWDGKTTVTVENNDNEIYFTIESNGETMDYIDGGVVLRIPYDDCRPGTVAVMISEDGERSVVRKSVAYDGYVTVPVDGTVRFEFVDNGTYFDDVPETEWFVDAVAFASGHELFKGMGDNMFAPNLSMTRGMLAQVMHNWENNPYAEFEGTFDDVDGERYYAEAVEWAAANGIVSGYGDGEFGPEDPITREQLAVMLHRHAGEPDSNESLDAFNDVDRISDYANTAIRWAVEKSIVGGKGDGNIDPKGNATRAEVAAMLMRYIKS